MNITKKKCLDILDRLENTTGRDPELEGEIYDLLIGPDAYDAKVWYGMGQGILLSTDSAIAFLARMGVNSWDVSQRASRGNCKGEILTPQGTFDGVAYRPAVALIRALFYYLLNEASRRGRSTTDAG